MNRTSGIRTAIVGLGRSGWDIHVKQLLERKEFQIVSVADPDPARAQEGANQLGCDSYPDLQSLLRGSDAELVCIATPSWMHEADTIRVLELGRHCVVEKPMALSFEAARRVLDAAEAAGRKLLVHHNFLFRDEYRHLREIVDRGILGQLIQIRACWFHFGRRNDWQTLRKYGGGMLNNTVTHTVSAVLDLLGAPVAELLSDLQQVNDPGDCEDHVHLFLKARNGCTADITSTTVCALPCPKWMLLGSCGTLSSDGQTSTIRYFDPKVVPPMTVVDGPAKDRQYVTDNLPWKEEVMPSRPTRPTSGFYDNVADVLLHDASMTVTPESALEVVRIIEWARRGTAFA